MATWRKQLIDTMRLYDETFSDIVSNTMTDQEMDTEFDDGYGGEEGCPFTVWTHNRVYFPVTYDGAEWVGSVSRNPDGKPKNHVGGS